MFSFLTLPWSIYQCCLVSMSLCTFSSFYCDWHPALSHCGHINCTMWFYFSYICWILFWALTYGGLFWKFQIKVLLPAEKKKSVFFSIWIMLCWYLLVRLFLDVFNWFIELFICSITSSYITTGSGNRRARISQSTSLSILTGSVVLC